MNFDEAYQRMKEGAAIARPGWRSIAYLFWQRDAVWAKHKTGRVQYFAFFQGKLTQGDDWFVVEVGSLPDVPAAKKQVTSNNLYCVKRRLSDEQEAMRRRWEKKAVKKKAQSPAGKAAKRTRQYAIRTARSYLQMGRTPSAAIGFAARKYGVDRAELSQWLGL